MLTAAPESFIENVGELKTLIHAHWKKLALDKDKVPLDPQWEVYFAREQAGELSFVVLRDAGRMVGYWITFIAPGLHYRTCLTATMDIWNVLPDYERAGPILTLSRAVLRELERRGVNRSFVGEKLHKPCGKLYRAMGYEAIETMYSKWIG